MSKEIIAVNSENARKITSTVCGKVGIFNVESKIRHTSYRAIKGSLV